jgi:hypothetical protein
MMKINNNESMNVGFRNWITKIILSLFLLITLLASPSFAAATHYIRAGASGSNNGSDWTNAWTTWPSTFVRGDTYYIGNGSYPSHNFTTANSGTTWIYVYKATVADHGVNTGWSDTYAGQAAIAYGSSIQTSYWLFDGQVGSGNDTSSYGFWSDSSSSCSDTGDTPSLDIQNSTSISNVTIRHWGFKVCNTNANDCTFGIRVYGAYGKGLNDPTKASYITLSYIYVWGASCSTRNVNTSHTQLDHSYIANNWVSSACHGGMINYYNGDTAAIFNNYFYQCRLDVIDIVGAVISNSSFYNNIIDTDNPNGQCMEAVSNENYPGVTMHNWQVYNNTIVNLSTPFYLIHSQDGGGGSVVYNNLYWNVPTPLKDNANTTYDYDAFYSSGSISETHGQVTSGNPFVSSSGKNFRLIGSTTAGITLGSPYNVDYNGIARTYWDRGAFEYSGSAAQIRPNPPSSLR